MITVGQEPLEPGLLSYVKIFKTPFFGNISNSCHWATQMGLKPTKNFFLKIFQKLPPLEAFKVLAQ